MSKPQHCLLRWFSTAHLPPELRKASEPFGVLAAHLDRQFDGHELDAALRKLLEAKDCIVRAALER